MPLVDGIESNLGRKLQEASAHSGYLSEPNLAALEARGIRAYIAAGRARYPAAAHNLRAALGEAGGGALSDCRRREGVGYGSLALGISRSVPDEFRQLAEKEL